MRRELNIKYNASINKNLLFRIGIDAGFFSEYNNMVFTIHYCMVNNIRFVMNSNNANFSFRKGWSDYFKPVLEENQFFLNKYYNTRLAPPQIVRLRDKIGYFFFKSWLILYKFNYTTWKILPEARKQDPKKKHSIDTMGWNGKLIENCTKISARIWQYQPDIRFEIQTRINKVKISTNYIGFHIRKGDKSNETKFSIPLENYILAAKAKSDCRNAFVATDDYTVIENLIKNYPDWNFLSWCKPNMRGYNQILQTKKTRPQIKEEMLDLFAEIEILSKADLFIGTYSSNIGIYMLMRLGEEKCVGVDFKSWQIW